MKRSLTLLLVLLVILAALCSLTGCDVLAGLLGCEHEWADATCTEPKHCEICGKTEGEALGHVGGKASCSEKAVCDRCGEEYGDYSAHSFADATCTTPKTCKDCGETEGEPLKHTGGTANCKDKAVCSLCGEPYGELGEHSFADATCTTPKTCTVCGETEGEPLKHTGGTANCKDKAVCSLCGEPYGELGGHSFADATCSAPKTCTVCGETEGNKLECEWGDWTPVGDGTHSRVCKNDPSHTQASFCLGGTPSCTEQGSCIVCGGKYGELLKHSFADATCSAPKTCTVCGATEGEPLKHAYVATVTKPTCDKGGYTTYVCSACGDSYTAEETEAAGHSYKSTVTKPTCTEGGYTTYVCSVCGDSYKGDEVAALGCEYGEWQSLGDGNHIRYCIRNNSHTETKPCSGGKATCTKPAVCTDCGTAYGEVADHEYGAVVTKPTCTEGGYTTYTCSVCSDSYTADATEAAGHSYEAVVTKPTCTEGGYTTYTCSVCSDSYTADATEAAGHSYEAVVTKPTCTEGGYTTYTCSVCSDSYTADEVAALGHSGGEATCKVGAACEVCGVVYTPPKGHSYEAVVTDPTCFEGGYTTYTCSVCGDSYTADETDALGCEFGKWQPIGGDQHVRYCERDASHNETAPCAGGEASCTEQAVCEACGAKYGELADHDYEAIVTEPSCFEGGYTTYTCAVCAHSFTSDETDPVGCKFGEWQPIGDGKHIRYCVRNNSHTESGVCYGGEASCTEQAVCEACGAKYGSLLDHSWKDATCTEPMTCEKCGATEGEAAGHKYEAVVTEPTCDKGGYTTYVCSVCGDSYTAEETEALGHELLEANCTEPVRCAKCDYTEGEALGHVGGEATCADKAVCEVCGSTYGQTLKHSFDSMSTDAKYLASAATCETNAYYYYSCANCGDRSDESFEAEGTLLGHVWTEWQSQDGIHVRYCINDTERNHTESESCSGGETTCTDRAICSVCGGDYGEEPGHAWSDGIITKQPGCTEAGVLTYSCSKCGGEMTEAIAPIGHSQYTEITEPSCTEGGYTTYGCSVCGETYTADETDPLGHSWDGDLTCESGHTCERCGESEEKLGHSYVLIKSEDATCSAPASETYACERCGGSYMNETAPALGHDIKGVEAIEEAIGTCTFIQKFKCNVCGELVDGQTITRHTEIATIEIEATCSSEGSKRYDCQLCEYGSRTTIPKNDNHKWDEGVLVGNVRTYTCQHDECGATKEVIDASADTSASLGSSDLSASGEVALKDASLNLGEIAGEGGAIANKDVTVSAGTLEGEDLEKALKLLTEEQKAQLGDSPIYNFTITEGGNAITDFGDNYVTVTIPYTPAEGEDVDSIAIWYVSDGTPVSIEATYAGGYVTFRTNHFSYYTVTSLTPAERCALYGHIWLDKTVEATCTTDGYTLHRCSGCAYYEKNDVVKAYGHSLSATTTPASCTEDGHSFVECTRGCGYSHYERISAFGHNYEITESIDATCEAVGSVTSVCGECGSKITVTTPRLNHSYEHSTVEPTCAAGGYRLHECVLCGYSYKDGFTDPLSHVFSDEWSFAEDKLSATVILTCENGCGERIVETVVASVREHVATCTKEGKTEYTAKLVYNGITYSSAISENGKLLEHKFDNGYKFNKHGHWLECSGCGGKATEEEHIFEGSSILKRPTCASEGEIAYTCVCGYVMVEKTAPTGDHYYVDGVCIDCGNTANAPCNHIPEVMNAIDLGELGYCDGMLVYWSCKCGENKQLNLEESTVNCDFTLVKSSAEIVIDEHMNPITAISSTKSHCDKCGLSIETTYEGSSVYADCSTPIFGCLSIIGRDGEAIATFNETPMGSSDNHSNVISGAYGLKGKICGGDIYVTACTECGEILSLDDVRTKCDFNVVTEEYLDDNGNPYTVTVKSCEKCGLTIKEESFVYSELCLVIKASTVTVSIDGNELFTVTTDVSSSEHELTEELVSLGDKCEDGHSMVTRCVNCDFTTTITILGHYLGSGYTDLESLGMCAGQVRYEGCAFCDEKVYTDIKTTCDWVLVEGEDAERYVCSVCGAERTVTVSVSEKDENCAFTTTVTESYYVGGKLLCSFKDEQTRIEHNKVGNTCADCGKDLSCTHEPTLNLVFDFGELGYCASKLPYMSCECGLVKTFDPMTSAILCDIETISGETGMTPEGMPYQHMFGKCRDCGILVEAYMIMSQPSPCVQVMSVDYRFYTEDGETVFEAGGEMRNENHSTAETTLGIADMTCGSEIYVRACTRCGKITSFNDVTQVCPFEPKMDQFVDEFGRPHMYQELYCPKCGLRIVGDMYAESVSPCVSTIYTFYYVYIGDTLIAESSESSHNSSHNYVYEYTLNGDSCDDGYTVVATCSACGNSYSYESSGHSTEWVEFNFAEYGLCPGWGEKGVCRICGTVTSVNGEPGCQWVSESYDEEGKYEEGKGGQQFCMICGATRECRSEYGEKDASCTIPVNEIRRYYRDGELLLDVSWSYHLTDHSFEYTYELYGESCTDGYTEHRYCPDCGESSSHESYGHNTVLRKTIRLADYGTCSGGYIYLYSCACGENGWRSLEGIYSGCDLEEWHEVNHDEYGIQHDLHYYHCRGCGLYIEFDDVRSYYGCKVETDTVINVRVGDVSVVENLEWTNGSHYEHDFDVTYKLLGDSCDDGFIISRTCRNCDHSEEETLYGHHTFREEIDLTSYGACGGWVNHEFCPCGANSHYNVNICGNARHSSNTYVEDGVIYMVEAYSCECGFRYQTTRYLNRIDGCTRYYNNDYYVSVGGELICEDSYENSELAHDYDVSYYLHDPDAGCESGINIYYSCSVCGECYEEQIYWHNLVIKTEYDLEKYGSVCGGKLVVAFCPCGRSYNCNVYDARCEFDEQGEVWWIDDAINASQEHADGYHGYWSYFYKSVCAVTDPEKCGFAYRHATYWVYEGNCTVVRYMTLQLGYNEADGSCIEEITFELERDVYHKEMEHTSESDGNGRYHWRETCTLCDSYVESEQYYNELGGWVYTQTWYNALDNGRAVKRTTTRTDLNEVINAHLQDPISQERTEILHADGSVTYTELNYTYELIDAPVGVDGYRMTVTQTGSEGFISREIYERSFYHHGNNVRMLDLSEYYEDAYGNWHKYTYLYEDGCICRYDVLHEYSDGESYLNENNEYHDTSWTTIVPPTCTQWGVEGLACYFCDTEFDNQPVSPLGHSWIMLPNGLYFCQRCALQNVNGADGSIVMEDLTDKLGGGENYVIGYFMDTYASFTPMVSIILHTPLEDGTDQLVLFIEESAFTYYDGSFVGLSIPIAIVEEAAREIGFEPDQYDARISFVPDGADSSFDYAITFGDLPGSEAIAGAGITSDEFIVEYLPEGASFTVMLTPETASMWEIYVNSANYNQIEITVTDENGNDLFYGSNCSFSLELEAGMTYYLTLTAFKDYGYGGDYAIIMIDHLFDR